MSIDKELLEILVCPKCKRKVIYAEKEDKLLCKHCKLKYRIEEGIPIMLPEEAEEM